MSSKELDLQRALAEQPERTLVEAGIHTALINSLPYETGGEPIVIVSMSKNTGKDLRPFIVAARGEQYMKWVIFSAVKDIHKWGAGYWSDRFYFVHDVIENISTLPIEDQTFIKLMISPAGMAEILQLNEKDLRKTIWQKVRSFFSR